MSDLAEILHNIADHTETFYRFLSEPGVADDIKARLIDHIILEETENTARLAQLHGAAPTALTQKMLDHSFILQRVMTDITMPQDLKQELLHHFMEEHAEWQTQIIGTASGHVEPGTTSGATVAHQQSYSSQPDHSHQAANHAANNQHSARSHGAPSGGHGGGGHGHSTSSNRTHEGHSKPSNQSGANQPEERQWTVGPLWNQGD
ncbi:MAG: hypothetical protein SGJ27_30355 [Candidatus Melainabacteria bacterium]|nr:hypothetical protein [Candidatus Melainabacteria bacterium]